MNGMIGFDLEPHDWLFARRSRDVRARKRIDELTLTSADLEIENTELRGERR